MMSDSKATFPEGNKQAKNDIYIKRKAKNKSKY